MAALVSLRSVPSPFAAATPLQRDHPPQSSLHSESDERTPETGTHCCYDENRKWWADRELRRSQSRTDWLRRLVWRASQPRVPKLSLSPFPPFPSRWSVPSLLPLPARHPAA